MKHIKSFFVISLFFILLGCGTSSTKDPADQNDLHLTNTSSDILISQSISKQVSEKLTNHETLTNIKSVNTDDTVLVVFEVDAFKRFQLAEIRKDVKKELDTEFPHMKIFVSTDQKINKEIDLIKQQIKSNSITNQTLTKSVNDLIKLAKEDT